jgi:uncharacterized lipoprotein YajG
MKHKILTLLLAALLLAACGDCKARAVADCETISSDAAVCADYAEKACKGE